MNYHDNARAGLLQLLHVLDLRPNLEPLSAAASAHGLPKLHLWTIDSMIAEYPDLPVRSVMCAPIYGVGDWAHTVVVPARQHRCITVNGIEYTDVIAFTPGTSEVAQVAS